MYDWNALWHLHQGYRTGYFKPADDLNALASELGARLVKAAHGPTDIAVYENDDSYMLLGHAKGLQMLTLARHALFDIAIRHLSRSESAQACPCIEVRASNLASGESATWLGPLHRDEQGRAWLEQAPLAEGVMPPLPFDELSFTDNARFRDLLYAAWQRALPELVAAAEHDEPAAAHPDADIALGRYQAIIRHRQAGLRHQFSQEERELLRQALRDIALDQPTQCRGLWLHVERWWLEQAPDRDLTNLIARLRELDPAAEFALLELLPG